VTKGSDLLVAALENEGVAYIFAIPGEENLDVLDSLRRSRIKLVLTRHEQAAGFMRPPTGVSPDARAFCLTTLGPGALNLTNGCGLRAFGAMPMVMITGQKAIRSSRQARYQIVDIVATMRPPYQMATQIVSRRVFRLWFATPSGSRSKSGRAPCISNCPRISRPMKPLRTSFPRMSSSFRLRRRWPSSAPQP